MLDITKINEPIKILGVYFTYDWRKREELNFDLILKSIKKIFELLAVEKFNSNWLNLNRQNVRYAKVYVSSLSPGHSETYKKGGAALPDACLLGPNNIIKHIPLWSNWLWA